MKMEKNVGGVDRVVRIILGLVIVALGVAYGSLWGIVGVVVLATGVFSWCGLYTILGVSTCAVKKTE